MLMHIAANAVDSKYQQELKQESSKQKSSSNSLPALITPNRNFNKLVELSSMSDAINNIPANCELSHIQHAETFDKINELFPIEEVTQPQVSPSKKKKKKKKKKKVVTSDDDVNSEAKLIDKEIDSILLVPDDDEFDGDIAAVILKDAQD